MPAYSSLNKLSKEELAKANLLEVRLVLVPAMNVWTVYSVRRDEWLRDNLVGQLGKYLPAKAYFKKPADALTQAGNKGNDDVWWA